MTNAPAAASSRLVVATIAMAVIVVAVRLADAERHLQGDGAGGQGRSDGQAAQHELGQSTAVRAELLHIVAPHLVPVPERKA